MILFNKSFMNGATLFGVSITLFSLVFVFISLERNPNVLIFGGTIYLIFSALAFFFPKLSEKLKK